MQQFKILLKKELLSYMRTSLFYGLLFIYLFASFASAFYFKDILTAKDTALFSLFSMQPYILAVIIPAITMKLWTDEYKNNSAEFLLTLPVSLQKVVAAKFCSAVILCSLLILSLLPFIIYVSFLLKLDYMNILCAYLGLEMLICFLCAIGVFISSLTENLIVSYVLSISVFLMLLMVPQSMLIITYHDFLFAEIGLFDVFYFISFSVLFLFFNKLVIEYRRNGFKNKPFLMFLLIVSSMVANLLVCWMLSVFDYKADLTQNRLYSLKKSSVEIVEKIRTPLEINLYISKDYRRNDYAIAYYFEQISRFLKKYQRKSKGLIKVNISEISAFSDEENSIIKNGIFAVKNDAGSKNYLGAVIKDNNGNQEVITMFLPERHSYLEEDVDRALLKVAFPELKKRVGVYFDGEQNLDDFEGAGLIFENEYNVGLLNNSSYQLTKDADAVILVNPKGLSPVFMYALDQYVINGGNLLIFADKQTENQFDDINSQTLSITRLLKNWGIELSDVLVDEGKVVGKFAKSQYPLKLKSACALDITGEDAKITPLIENDDKLIGAIVQKEFKSFYSANPYKQTLIGPMMRPYRSRGGEGKVAVVCDADILLEGNWIAKSSPDRNIFGTIEIAGNGRFIQLLTDYMTNNNLYDILPQNDYAVNISGIGEKIAEKIKKSTENEEIELNAEISDLSSQVWKIADYDEENLSMVLDFTDAGRELQSVTEQLNNIKYEQAKAYNDTINKLKMILIIILPLVETLALFLVYFAYQRRKNKKIKELLK